MKYETAQKQDANAKEQEQLLGYWIKRYGITKRDLDSHPQIDDLMLLIRWKAEFYCDGKAKHKRFFDNTWNWVYHNRLPLKKKQLNTLGYYAEGTIRHRLNIQAGRNTIKAQREYRKALEAQ
jgi:hypothetical protein